MARSTPESYRRRKYASRSILRITVGLLPRLKNYWREFGQMCFKSYELAFTTISLSWAAILYWPCKYFPESGRPSVLIFLFDGFSNFQQLPPWPNKSSWNLGGTVMYHIRLFAPHK